MPSEPGAAGAMYHAFLGASLGIAVFPPAKDVWRLSAETTALDRAIVRFVDAVMIGI